MLNTNETIRLLLEQKNLTVEELAIKANMKKEAIINVMYGRSKKYIYFKRIAEALNVSVDTLTGTAKSANLDLLIYEICVKLVIKELKILKIQYISLNTLNTYINKAYDILNEGKNEEFTSIFLKGMIEGQLKYNILEQIKSSN